MDGLDDIRGDVQDVNVAADGIGGAVDISKYRPGRLYALGSFAADVGKFGLQVIAGTIIPSQFREKLFGKERSKGFLFKSLFVEGALASSCLTHFFFNSVGNSAYEDPNGIGGIGGLLFMDAIIRYSISSETNLAPATLLIEFPFSDKEIVQWSRKKLAYLPFGYLRQQVDQMFDRRCDEIAKERAAKAGVYSAPEQQS